MDSLERPQADRRSRLIAVNLRVPRIDHPRLHFFYPQLCALIRRHAHANRCLIAELQRRAML
jgi:hypothetical protein